MNNNHAKLALGALLGTAVFSLGTATYRIQQKNATTINTAKAYLKEKVEPHRYLQMVHENLTVLDWRKEVKAVQDSLKVDSMCKKAYWEGAQMVRDSIKTAAKSVK